LDFNPESIEPKILESFKPKYRDVLEDPKFKQAVETAK